MTRFVATLVLVTALLASATASADCGNDNGCVSGGSYGGVAAIVMADVLLPPALLVGDALVRPQSKAYGGFEIVVGGVTGLLNGAVANGSEEDRGVFLAFTAIDLAVAAHGAYLLLHEDAAGDRLSLAPSVVTDGKATAPGFAVAGAW